MKGKQGLYVVLFATASILFLASIFLLIQNNHYRNVNRQLILDNDSIISVNIQLKNTLKKDAVVDVSGNDAKQN
jgi:hypothetical protein